MRINKMANRCSLSNAHRRLQSSINNQSSVTRSDASMAASRDQRPMSLMYLIAHKTWFTRDAVESNVYDGLAPPFSCGAKSVCDERHSPVSPVKHQVQGTICPSCPCTLHDYYTPISSSHPLDMQSAEKLHPTDNCAIFLRSTTPEGWRTISRQ